MKKSHVLPKLHLLLNRQCFQHGITLRFIRRLCNYWISVSVKLYQLGIDYDLTFIDQQLATPPKNSWLFLRRFVDGRQGVITKLRKRTVFMGAPEDKRSKSMVRWKIQEFQAQKCMHPMLLSCASQRALLTMISSICIIPLPCIQLKLKPD